MPSLLIASQSDSDKCAQYASSVAYWHKNYFGMEFPYQYGIGQLKQESNCKFVKSKDGYGSVGAAQITISVWQKRLPDVDFWSVDGNMRAQAYANKDSMNQAKVKKLWVMFQIYNGGGVVNTEIKSAGVADWEKAKAQCRRGVTKYKSGDRSNCDINYEYSQNIFKYAKEYSNVQSNQFRFW
ncbi:MAG: hypothetical protein NTW78_03885 [Campylobacterales bacterium]|nr:hypothetical protein [Campylobacterales bacterium]